MKFGLSKINIKNDIKKKKEQEYSVLIYDANSYKDMTKHKEYSVLSVTLCFCNFSQKEMQER